MRNTAVSDRLHITEKDPYGRSAAGGQHRRHPVVGHRRRALRRHDRGGDLGRPEFPRRRYRRQTFDAAQAALDQAKDACARLKQLYDAESLPQIKWVEAQTRLRQAESAYGIARKNLDDCKLYAPFTGVIGKRQAAAGETVMPGVPAMTLLRIGTVKVRFPVPEQEIARLGTDSRLRITVAALGDRAFPAGKIEKGAVANPATHTYDVRATLSNADGELLPGMVCRVEASPAGAAEEIALPVRAVQQAGDGSRFVWKVSGDSVVRTAVATGRLVNNAVTITAGIQAGDRIVTDGMQKIGQGSKVIAE